jgi:hypothetical protein
MVITPMSDLMKWGCSGIPSQRRRYHSACLTAFSCNTKIARYGLKQLSNACTDQYRER